VTTDYVTIQLLSKGPVFPRAQQRYQQLADLSDNIAWQTNLYTCAQKSTLGNEQL